MYSVYVSVCMCVRISKVRGNHAIQSTICPDKQSHLVAFLNLCIPILGAWAGHYGHAAIER